MEVEKMSSIKGQYLVDAQGHPKAVVISIHDYRKMLKLMADLRDVRYIRRHRHEKLIPMQEVHRHLKKENLV